MDQTANRDLVTSVLFGIAIVLTAFVAFAGFYFARSGRPELLEVALLLMAVFAVIGMVLGLMRSLRGTRASR